MHFRTFRRKSPKKIFGNEITSGLRNFAWVTSLTGDEFDHMMQSMTNSSPDKLATYTYILTVRIMTCARIYMSCTRGHVLLYYLKYISTDYTKGQYTNKLSNLK